MILRLPYEDGLQQAGNLNALLAFQLAHIILGHRLDTKFAFNDTLIFPTITIFNRISMHAFGCATNAEAAKKAVQLLSATELVDGQQYFGLYLKQLQQQSKALMSLNAPMLGDALVKSGADPTFWMAPLMGKASKLDVNDISSKWRCRSTVFSASTRGPTRSSSCTPRMSRFSAHQTEYRSK